MSASSTPSRSSSRRRGDPRDARHNGHAKRRKSPALKMVMEMMAIPGISCEEGRIAEYVRKQLRGAGVPAEAIKMDRAHQKTPTTGDVGNLVLKLPGRGAPAVRRAPRRVLMAHLDTVPICVGSRPVWKQGPGFAEGYVESASPQTGLGADDRAGAAVVLDTALATLRREEHPPLTFFWTVQEEIGIQGVRQASLGLLGRPRLAFNFDGGSPCKLTRGATGGYRLTIDVHGVAAHAGGAPEFGVSAIAIASLAIAELQQNGWHGAIRKGRQQGTSNVGTIEGGAATNVVTDHVRLRAEARSPDSKFRQRIVTQIEKAFARAAATTKNVAGQSGRVSFEGGLDYESFYLEDDDPSLLAAEEAVRRVGGQPLRFFSNGGLDANWMTPRGIPTVTLGCGQLYQHTTEERLDVARFHEACQIARLLAWEAGT
ncbi:MAG: M20/M25/M40 family metallo-hydrolase [Planctomycetota bacterium]|nr:MAG: M20/M25/M40 family metallo-hydrolase [Planctomycetota bacterium]REK42394.1 MAG: M20/M25/M40 family metallo-hydrolase [Planctomycetota bacterium]